MLEKEIKKYQTLNKLADTNGIIVFGGTDDKNIPICELKQAFELNSKLYNRSITNLSINTAIKVYDDCITSLKPESILLHIGAADLDFFVKDSSAFEKKYCELIKHIKSSNAKCNIVIISLNNPDEAQNIDEMNKHLKYIAQSEQCEFGDISTKRVWNPLETKNVLSFVASLHFCPSSRPKLPIYDLIKILFCSTLSCAE